MSSSSVNDNENLFHSAVYGLFYNWTSFQLAVNNNFGGSETKEKADWFINATYEWIIENNDLEDDELEEFFLDTMDKEFNTILDDNSALEVARRVLVCFNLYKNKNLVQLHNEIEKLNENFSNKKQNSVKVAGDVESSSDDEDDDGEEEEGMDENNNEEEKAKKQEAEAMEINEAMENVDEGWTLVYKAGKHITK